MKEHNVTPTWTGILPVLLALLENGDSQGQKTAREELQRMAAIADLWVAHESKGDEK